MRKCKGVKLSFPNCCNFQPGHRFQNMRDFMNSILEVLSMSHRKVSLVLDIFTYVSGKTWCLRLFTPSTKVLEIIGVLA